MVNLFYKQLWHDIIFYISDHLDFFLDYMALWHAAREHQKNWFIALAIIGFIPGLSLYTFGIIDIIFLFKFAHKPLTIAKLKSWFSKAK